MHHELTFRRKIDLRDIVNFDIGPRNHVKARVVLLGNDQTHLEMCSEYLQGIQEINLVESNMIAAEYLDKDGNPVGSYCPTTLGGVELVKKSV